jgi:hypothetical protein
MYIAYLEFSKIQILAHMTSSLIILARYSLPMFCLLCYERVSVGLCSSSGWFIPTFRKPDIGFSLAMCTTFGDTMPFARRVLPYFTSLNKDRISKLQERRLSFESSTASCAPAALFKRFYSIRDSYVLNYSLKNCII